jgi:hypothetical protein
MKRLTALALMLACGSALGWSAVRADDDVPAIETSAGPADDYVPEIEVSAGASDDYIPAIEATAGASDDYVPAIESSASGWIDNSDQSAANTTQVPENNRSQISTWNYKSFQNSLNENTSVINTMDPAMREWFNANLPKSEHAELFGRMLGDWTTTLSWRIAPDAQPEVSTGRASNTSNLQRFVRQEFDGEMLPGMKFQGSALFGFNNATKQYENVWIDNTTTAITTNVGAKQADGSILWTGSFTDPATGEKKTSKATLSWQGNNQMTWTQWDVSAEGVEFASLEVVYTRNTQASNAQREFQRQQDFTQQKRRSYGGTQSFVTEGR